MLICKQRRQSIRWKEGERLDHLFEQRCDELHAASDGIAAVVTDDATYHVSRARRPRQPGGALPARPGPEVRRPHRPAVRQVRRHLRRAAGGAEDQRRLRAARRRLSRTTASASSCSDAEVKAIVSLSAFRPKLDDVRRPRRSSSTPPRARSTRKPTGRLADPRAAAPVDQLCLHHLHLGHDRQAQGRGDRACQHLQLRAGRGRGLRHRGRATACYQGMTIAFDFSVEEIWVPLIAGATLVPGKPGTSLVGGDLARFPAERARHRAVLRADAAGHDREGPAGPALPAGLRRGLPAGPGRALAPPGPHDPQRLRPDRGDRHRDADRAVPGQAGDHRRAAADLHDRHPRPRQGRGAVARGEIGRDRHRRHRARRRLPQPRRPDGEEVHPGLPRTSRTTRRGASTAPATSAASTTTTRSSTTAASTRRSRSAATASS